MLLRTLLSGHRALGRAAFRLLAHDCFSPATRIFSALRVCVGLAALIDDSSLDRALAQLATAFATLLLVPASVG